MGEGRAEGAAADASRAGGAAASWVVSKRWQSPGHQGLSQERKGSAPRGSARPGLLPVWTVTHLACAKLTWRVRGVGRGLWVKAAVAV